MINKITHEWEDDIGKTGIKILITCRHKNPIDDCLSYKWCLYLLIPRKNYLFDKNLDDLPWHCGITYDKKYTSYRKVGCDFLHCDDEKTWLTSPYYKDESVSVLPQDVFLTAIIIKSSIFELMGELIKNKDIKK